MPHKGLTFLLVFTFSYSQNNISSHCADESYKDSIRVIIKVISK